MKGHPRHASGQDSRPVLVLARAGDPLMKEGRARLIWAANTANAVAELGGACHLVGTAGYSWNPMRWRRHISLGDPSEKLRRFYNVKQAFSVGRMFVPTWLRSRGAAFLEQGAYQVRWQLSAATLKQYVLVHTRDWRVAETAVRAGVPTIYEDHHESFNEEQQAYPGAIVEQPSFLGAVAISPYVAELMELKGMPAAKLMVEDSGVSARSLALVSADIRASRRAEWLAGTSCRHLIGYSGGLHGIRGIELLLHCAQRLPEALFLIAGGRGRQVRQWQQRAAAAGLSNVRFLGYRPQTELPPFLQSMDLLALPYASEATAPITSPLKFFEYLAAQRPVVACRMPALARFERRDDLLVDWCRVGDADEFARKLGAALQRAHPETGSDAFTSHAEIARSQTWEARERRILAAGGVGLAGGEATSPADGGESELNAAFPNQRPASISISRRGTPITGEEIFGIDPGSWAETWNRWIDLFLEAPDQARRQLDARRNELRLAARDETVRWDRPEDWALVALLTAANDRRSILERLESLDGAKAGVSAHWYLLAALWKDQADIRVGDSREAGALSEGLSPQGSLLLDEGFALRRQEQAFGSAEMERAADWLARATGQRSPLEFALLTALGSSVLARISTVLADCCGRGITPFGEAELARISDAFPLESGLNLLIGDYLARTDRPASADRYYVRAMIGAKHPERVHYRRFGLAVRIGDWALAETLRHRMVGLSARLKAAVASFDFDSALRIGRAMHAHRQPASADWVEPYLALLFELNLKAEARELIAGLGTVLDESTMVWRYRLWLEIPATTDGGAEWAEAFLQQSDPWIRWCIRAWMVLNNHSLSAEAVHSALEACPDAISSPLGAVAQKLRQHLQWRRIEAGEGPVALFREGQSELAGISVVSWPQTGIIQFEREIGVDG